MKNEPKTSYQCKVVRDLLKINTTKTVTVIKSIING